MEIKTPDMVRNSRNENKGPKWKFPLLMENNAKIGINTKMEIATLMELNAKMEIATLMELNAKMEIATLNGN